MGEAVYAGGFTGCARRFNCNSVIECNGPYVRKIADSDHAKARRREEIVLKLCAAPPHERHSGFDLRREEAMPHRKEHLLRAFASSRELKKVGCTGGPD